MLRCPNSSEDLEKHLPEEYEKYSVRCHLFKNDFVVTFLTSPVFISFNTSPTFISFYTHYCLENTCNLTTIKSQEDNQNKKQEFINTQNNIFFFLNDYYSAYVFNIC